MPRPRAALRGRLALVAAVALALALAAGACSSSGAAAGGAPSGEDGGGASGDGDGGRGGSGVDGDLGDDGSASSGEGGTPCALDTTAGQHQATCRELKLAVEVPAACAGGAGSCGAVLDIHGTFMTGDDEDAQTNLRALGGAAGYLVVQPTAPTSTANGPSWFPSDDDAVFASFMDVVHAFSADPKKLHVTGFSAGGYMTWRMVCKHSDVFASAAPGAAGGTACAVAGLNDTCPFTTGTTGAGPSHRLDVLFLVGRNDGVVPPSCMEAERDAAVAYWSLGSSQHVAGDTTYERTRYAASGQTLEVIEHDYTTDPGGVLASNRGHCYPGSHAARGDVQDLLACQAPNAFAWGDEAMKFFVAHPKP